MITPPENWATVRSMVAYDTIYRYQIEGCPDYVGSDRVVDAEITPGLFGQAISTGNTQSAELILKCLPAPGDIPRGARVVAEVALSTDGVTPSTGWAPAGTYYINGRREDRLSGVLTLTCYDRMYAGDGIFEPGGVGSYPMGLHAAVAQCAAVLGVEMDPRSDALGSDDTLTIPDAPTAETLSVRDVLRLAGICSIGNFVITAENRLRFLALSGISGGLVSTSVLACEDGEPLSTEAGELLLVSSLSAVTATGQNIDVIDLGYAADTAEDMGEFQVTAVRIYTSGSGFIETTYEDPAQNTGYTLTVSVADHPELVDAPAVAALYGALVNCRFRAIDVDSAIWDPLAEVGDLLEVAGMTSVVSEVVIHPGPLTLADLQTPGIGETAGEILFRRPTGGR